MFDLIEISTAILLMKHHFCFVCLLCGSANSTFAHAQVIYPHAHTNEQMTRIQCVWSLERRNKVKYLIRHTVNSCMLVILCVEGEM